MLKHLSVALALLGSTANAVTCATTGGGAECPSTTTAVSADFLHIVTIDPSIGIFFSFSNELLLFFFLLSYLNFSFEFDPPSITIY